VVKKQDLAGKKGKLSTPLLKLGWILMFVGTPLGSGIGAFPFLLAGKIFKKRERIEKDFLFFLINIFICASLISIINAKRKLFVLGSVITLALVLYLVCLGAEYIVLRRDFLNKLIKIFILCSVLSSIYGLVIYFGGFGGGAKALFSTNPNDFGTTMIPAIIGTLACFTHTSGKKKLLLGISLFIILMGLLFSFSRGTWLGAIGGVLVYGIYYKKDRFQIVALIVIMMVILFIYTPLFHRLSSIPDLSYSSNKTRIYIWEITRKMIKDHPLAGVGMGNYPLVYPEYNVGAGNMRNFYHAHNIFLQMWTECGIGALSAFTALIFLTLVKGRKIAKYGDSFLKIVGVVSLSSFVGILIQNQVDCTVYSIHIGSFFFLLAGVIFYSEKLMHKLKKSFEPGSGNLNDDH